MISRFYGGLLDGQTRSNIRGLRYVVRVDDRTRETYVRDRNRYEYDENHVPAVIAYKLESIERCVEVAGHEGSCRYEVAE